MGHAMCNVITTNSRNELYRPAGLYNSVTLKTKYHDETRFGPRQLSGGALAHVISTLFEALQKTLSHLPSNITNRRPARH